MPDNETKITLTGEDKTGPMHKSAQKNISDTAKELEKLLGYGEKESRYWQKRAKDTRTYYEDFLKMQVRAREATRAHDEAREAGNRKVTEGITRQTTAASGLASGLVALAGRYVSVTAAAETARRAFLNFAAAEKQMKQLQNTTGMTDTQVRRFSDSLDQMANDTKNTSEDANISLKMLRNGMNLTAEEAKKMFPQVAVQSHGMNTGLLEGSKLITDFVRNFKIAKQDAPQAMEAVSFAIRKLGLDAGELAPHADKVASSMNSMGYTGIPGLTKTLALIASLKKEFGSTSEAADAMTRATERFARGDIGEMMNIPARVWERQMRRAKENGTLVETQVGMLEKAKNKAAVIEKLSVEDQKVFNKLLEDNNGLIQKNIDSIEKATKAQAGLVAGMNQMTGADGAVKSLTGSINDLSKAFGGLLNAIGVPTLLNEFTAKINSLNTLIKELDDLVSGRGLGGKKVPGFSDFFPHKPRWPHPHEVWRGMARGSRGDAAKRIEQQTAPPPTLQGLTPGQTENVYKPISYKPGEEEGLIERGAIWIAGKLYRPQDNRQRGPVSGTGVRGGLPGGGYGGSADSLYLPANFRMGGGGGGGGGGGFGDGPRQTSTFTGAGPTGPGTYGRGTAYGTTGAPIRTGGGAPAAGGMPVVPGAGGVPSAILAKAQEVAAAGGPGAVSQFMAQQGYPKAGAWCGQFAASVVKASGGTPPANPQVASNWRNFGTKVDTPQAGDIAVKIGSRFGGGRTATGATGSHVTVVSSVGERGTFQGLGGNQGGGRLTTSGFSQSGYEFFRGGGNAAGAQPAVAAAGAGGGLGGGFQSLFAGTKMQGQEAAVIQAANKYGVSPALVASIIAHESGKGTSRFINQLNNPAGLMDPKTNWMKGQQFGSIGEGIEASARTIAKNLARGGGTIEGMGRLYAPPGAANDPRGLNSGWAAGVRGYLARLGGGPLGGGAASVGALTGTPTGGRAGAAPSDVVAAGAGKAEQLRKMGFVYDPDTGQPLRQFDPYTGAKLATAGKEGVPGSAAGGIHPGIAAERERRKQESVNNDIAREKQLRSEISNTQNAEIASRKNKYGGEAAPQGGAMRVDPNTGKLYRMGPSTRGVGGEAAPMGGARPVGRRLPRMGPRTRGVGGEAAPMGGMPEPVEVAQERRRRELGEITDRQNARREQDRTDEMNQRARDAGSRIGRAPDPVSTVEEASDTSSVRAAGGPVTGGAPYLVGEKGPEMFTPNNSGYIHANSSYANIDLKVNDAQVQFARTSMRRSADREVREARWNSYSDIGAA